VHQKIIFIQHQPIFRSK